MIDPFRISALIGYLSPAAGEIGKHQSKDITMSNDEKPDNSPDGPNGIGYRETGVPPTSTRSRPKNFASLQPS